MLESTMEYKMENKYPPTGAINRNLFHQLRAREGNLDLKRRASFLYDVYPNKSLVGRLGLSKVLKKHEGCVNTVNWSKCGRYLVSGSDDTNICVWDYHKDGKLIAHIESGHTANIFCTKFMPFCGNSKIISCAGDHDVRAFHLDIDTGASKRTHTFLSHQGRVKKLSTWEDDPNRFLSASEDGTVRLFDLRESSNSGGKLCVNFRNASEGVEINSVDISGNYFCIGGSDPITRVYDIRNLRPDFDAESSTCATFAPYHLVKDPPSSFAYSSRGHITGVAFHKEEILASYSCDDIYLFNLNNTKQYNQKEAFARYRRKRKREDVEMKKNEEEKKVDQEVEMTDASEEETLGFVEPKDFFVQNYTGHCNIRTVKGVSFFGPSGEYVASGSDDGKIFIWDKMTGKLINLMQGDRHVVNIISGHPFDCIMATSGIENHVKIWAPQQEKASSLEDQDAVKQSNKQRLESNMHRRAVPLSLLRRLLRTAAFEFAVPRYQENDCPENNVFDSDEQFHVEEGIEDDSDSGEASSGTNVDSPSSDEGEVECQLQ